MKHLPHSIPILLTVLAWSTAITSAQEAVQSGPWGDEHHGLQCRVTAPSEIEQGLPLEVDFELRSDPAKLKTGTKSLNVFLIDAFVTLKLTHLESNKALTIQPYDPTSGMLVLDEGRHTVALDGTPIKPYQVSFPLATAYDELTPGTYEGRVHFSFPENRTTWWRGTPEQWRTAGFWHGSVSSQPFRLEITKQPEKTKTVLLPRRLSAMTEKNEQDRPIAVVRFRDQDAEKISLPVRNGHFLGWKVIEAGTQGFSMMQGGTPRPNDVNSITEWPHDKSGEKRSITIEVFETAVPAHHHWLPETSGYRVLWKKTIEIAVKP